MKAMTAWAHTHDLALGRGRTCDHCGDKQRGSASAFRGRLYYLCHPSCDCHPDCYREDQREFAERLRLMARYLPRQPWRRPPGVEGIW